jgi:hypothetical protein
VRVPGIVISAYTAKGTIIGADSADASTIFDHSSVLATAEKLFGLKSLTKRDAAANTLEVAINSSTPRLSPADALTQLPPTAPDTAVAAAVHAAQVVAAAPKAALSTNQKAMADLALACELQITDPKLHPALISNHRKIVEQKDAADYIQSVEDKIKARRKPRSAK